MNKTKRPYAKTFRNNNATTRTLPDLEDAVINGGMPATLAGSSFRIEIQGTIVLKVTEHRYMLR